jgi:tetratricopeptide (TPR) repeat protein
VAYPALATWRKNRILRAAHEFIAADDYRRAFLLLDSFVKKNPTHYEARRLYAKVLEVASPDQSVGEWASLCQLESANPANHVGWATAALKVGRYGDIPAALDRLAQLQPDGLDYHRLAAAFALAQGQREDLERHLSALVRLEPQNALSRFSLSVLLLESADPAAVNRGRQMLDTLAKGETVRVRATLALLADAPRRWPSGAGAAKSYRLLAAVLGLSGQIGGESEKPNLLEDGEGHLRRLIGHMQASPGEDPGDAGALARWMMQVGRGREALVWLETLEPRLRDAPEVRSVMADCALSLELWGKLERLLADGAWGPAPREAVRLAFVARARPPGEADSRARSVWNHALRLSEQSYAGLNLLQRLAQAWGRPDWQTQALWVLVRQFPMEQPAWRTLTHLALDARDSAQLWRVYEAWAQVAPAHTNVQIERVIVGLLVRPNEDGLVEKAGQLYRANPAVPACRVAQALAWWRTGQVVEALGALDSAPLNYAGEPRFALARGLVLSALGRGAESEQMLAAWPASQFLPEEETLIHEAHRRNSSR